MRFEIDRCRGLYRSAADGGPAAAAGLGPVRAHLAGAVLGDPGPHRGGRLRRVLAPGPRPDPGEGRGRRPGRPRSAGLSRAARGRSSPSASWPGVLLLARVPTPRPLRRRPTAVPAPPAVSIVVPARDEERTLPVLLTSLRALDPAAARGHRGRRRLDRRHRAVAAAHGATVVADRPAAPAGRASRGPATSAPRPPPARTCSSSTRTRGSRPRRSAPWSPSTQGGAGWCRCSRTTAPSGPTSSCRPSSTSRP